MRTARRFPDLSVTTPPRPECLIVSMTTAIEAKPRAVVAWRFEALCRAGYSEREALELAMRPDVDLHQAIELLRQGCERETALRILR